MTEDRSNGYEAIADTYIAVRSSSGRALVQRWAASLPAGAAVIDLGAGSGEPITSALVEAGLDVCAIDASPAMVTALRQRFETMQIACETAEESTFFGRTFDAVLAVGLIFLLEEDAQRTLIDRLSQALNPGGRLLFSAPYQVGGWTDVLTGQASLSLGRDAYRALLEAAGLTPLGEHEDEGGTHYYEAQKP